MFEVIVWSLLVVVQSEGGAVSYTRDFPTERLCKAGEGAAHDAAKSAIGVLDVGTLCVQTKFAPSGIKPRA